MNVPAIKVQLALWNPNIFWSNLFTIRKQSSKHIQFTQENICVYNCLTHDHELYQNQLSQLFVFSVLYYYPTSYGIVKTNTRYLQMLLVSPYRFTSKNAEWLEIKVIILIIDICLVIITWSGRTWVLPQASQHYSQQQPAYTMYKAVNLSYLVCYDHIFVCALYTAANASQHYSQQQPEYTVCTKLLICHILYVMIIYLCVCVVYCW